MKKYKKLILSVLLFAFAFFTVHDYVLESIDTDTQYELYYLQNDKASLDMASKVHDTLHTAFEIPLQSAPSITLSVANSKPLLLKTTFLSHIGIVPQRPPLG
ncbi:MAG TPA: hypothetical protein CFH84_04245 [Sulfurimonas sp. UBA12504]|nr:MAG: hypothetical protein A2019_03250 [Sulfurimonas sp. GWF2_37_8]DAB30416.1 MAG TPA: hypothetical protein CFH84_04245 [Sulfurimonas sp. UBA12504]